MEKCKHSILYRIYELNRKSIRPLRGNILHDDVLKLFPGYSGIMDEILDYDNNISLTSEDKKYEELDKDQLAEADNRAKKYNFDCDKWCSKKDIDESGME